ncbi:hypothetical protein O181_041222 [Austropuccinia psidii MF-1]|uniref:Uncharacterized protein n=1 Tax=Austropuccinia psidii MF-1 TaxID=1389203 RepID=A0A9Q3HEM8_9BASI|nr:hypothetical protein [Austropuccinia psidii MF-1]
MDGIHYHPYLKSKKIKEYHAKKREASKEEAAVASTSKHEFSQTPQEGKKKRKNNWRKPYSKNPKRCHEKCLPHYQNLDGIQVQRVTKNGTTPFPK